MLSTLKKIMLTCACIAVLPVMGAKADYVDVGVHEADYEGFSRGFSYTAPVDHVITEMMLPPDLFAAGDISHFLIEVDDVVQVYSIGNTSDTLATNVFVSAGQEVLIVGNWTTGAAGSFTAKNSYHNTSPYASSILGFAVDLFRAGYQSDIGDGTYVGGAGFTGLTGAHGRIFINVEAAIPEPTTLSLIGTACVGLVFVRRRRSS